MSDEGVYTKNEVQNENREINEIHEIHEYTMKLQLPTSQPLNPLHSTIDDLIGHHVLSTLGNSQGWQLSCKTSSFTLLR